VLAVWESATDEEREEGMGWYSAARTFAVGLTERYGVTLEQACGVLAAISPRLAWAANMVYADQLVRTGDAPILGSSKAKALRILEGEPVESVLRCAVCARGDTRKHVCFGEKVRSFYACITDPESDAVCVDRHAYDVAVGCVTGEIERKALDRVGVYERVADCYRAAGAILGVSATLVQAVTWVAWRNAKAVR
jgi:hypothetical protein